MNAFIGPIGLLAALSVSGLAGCGGGGRNDSDGGPDSAVMDAGPDDAAPEDTGTLDAAPEDTGTPDAGLDDAGAGDAGPSDAGDAGPLDAGPPVPPGRAFRGAPPTVPHDAFGCGIGCLSCHETGSGGAPMTSHPERTICTMCHLFADRTLAPFVANSFRP